MYSQYKFYTKEKLERNLLVAVLQSYDFNGFLEESDALTGFVDASLLSREDVDTVLKQHELNFITYDYNELQDTNWNSEWESSFQPVVIDDVCILASFHPKSEVKYEIIIDPKMSFGTGHHATTELMIRSMSNIDFKNKTVLDIGSGTGILSIYASMLGAEKIDAIDNEEWAFENCIENCSLNNINNVNPILGDADIDSDTQYDIVLANINLNIISKNLVNWNNLLKKGGVLLLSGLLEDDENVIKKIDHRLNHIKTHKLNGWILIELKK
jgi:ribosomal protein L11 methyltransferase